MFYASYICNIFLDLLTVNLCWSYQRWSIFLSKNLVSETASLYPSKLPLYLSRAPVQIHVGQILISPTPVLYNRKQNTQIISLQYNTLLIFCPQFSSRMAYKSYLLFGDFPLAGHTKNYRHFGNLELKTSIFKNSSVRREYNYFGDSNQNWQFFKPPQYTNIANLSGIVNIN